MYGEDNEIHAAERDEHRSALRAMNEADRATACRHTTRTRGGVCIDCSEQPDDDDDTHHLRGITW